MVFLHALGQCLIRTGIGTIGSRAELGFALTTRLIADRGRRFTRRQLTALFWPDVEERSAAHSLSEALHRLRARGVPIESDSTQAVWIDRDAATIDVDRIPEMRPVDLVKCDFVVLPGFEPRGAPALRDWADEFRHQLTVRTVRNLATPIASAERDGEWEIALTLAEHALRLDGEDPVALDARARAAQALRGRSPARATGGRRQSIQAETVREAPPLRCDVKPQPTQTEKHRGNFVGRLEEQRILADAWTQAAAGSGRLITITGQSGIGKSRLLREFISSIRRSGGAGADASCDPPDREKPMSTLVRLVPRLRRLPGAAGCSPELLPYLDRLTEYNHGSGRLPDATDVVHLAQCVEHAVEELVDAIADEQPLVIAIDNAQWMDPDSARVIETLVRRGTSRSLLIVLVSCDPLPDEAGGQCGRAIPIQLEPLSDDAARSLIEGLLTNDRCDVCDPVIDWIVRAGEGHPLWLAELVQHWLTTGKDFTVPPSLAALLRARIANLAPLERRVLQIVAMLGHGATVARTSRAADVGNSELLDALDGLGAARLLVTNPNATAHGAPELACRHDEVANAAIAQLSPPAVALLHQQIALVLDDEASHSGSADLLWQRATHWTAGARSDRFVDVGLECVRHLLEIGLIDASIAACRDLRARCATPGDAARVDRSLAELLHLTHRWSEFATAIASIPRKSGDHDELELLVLDAEWQQGLDYRSTLASALSCAGAATATDSHRISAATLALKIATNLGDLHAIEHARTCVQAITSAGMPGPDALMFEMIRAAVDGCGAAAADHARALLQQLAQKAGESRLRLLLNCAVALGRGGAVGEANAVCEQVYAAAPNSGLPRLSFDACRRGALLMADHGRFEEARVWIGRLGAEPYPILSRAQQGAIDVIRAKLAVFDGNPVSALAILADLGAQTHREHTPMFDAAVLAVRIVAQVRCGCAVADVARDVGRLEELERRLIPIGGQDYEAVALATGQAYVSSDELARSVFTHYLTSGRRDPYPLPAALLAMLEDGVGAATG